MRYYYTPNWKAKSKEIGHTSFWWGYGTIFLVTITKEYKVKNVSKVDQFLKENGLVIWQKIKHSIWIKSLSFSHTMWKHQLQTDVSLNVPPKIIKLLEGNK